MAARPPAATASAAGTAATLQPRLLSGYLLRHPARDDFQFGGGGGLAHARRQPRDHVEPALGAGAQLRRVECEGIPQGHRGIVGKAEIGRHDADDLVRRPVERDRPPDRARIPAQPAAPERVAQHHHPIAPWDLLLGQESSPQGWCHAEQAEQVGRRAHGGQLLRLALPGEARSPRRPMPPSHRASATRAASRGSWPRRPARDPSPTTAAAPTASAGDRR